MTKGTPKVTITTPTYNRAGFLPETIESILGQTFGDFEYLIIDDGSTDNTYEVVAQYLKDERVRYIYQQNGGEPSAVNRGWQLASGEYFTQINSDDPVLPRLLEEMCNEMDKHPEAVVGYCDFNLIDETGKVISTTKSPNWELTKCLSEFNCYVASPGTFFRRSAFAHWKNLRKSNYKHINDIDMFWDMALEGPFLHVPKVLANWREHRGQISNRRYLAIPEVERWYEYFFSREDLPEEVRAVQQECRAAIDRYELRLVDIGDMPESEKIKMRYGIFKRIARGDCRYINLQVGDKDLIGDKFNGHNLHILLQRSGVQSYHYVTSKQSNDDKTFRIYTSENDNYARQMMLGKEFLLADIVHLHLIHNTNFDINLLPLISSLKPLVITLHDSFFLAGHCVHSYDCEKWKSGCVDCEHIEWQIPLVSDISSIKFEEKRMAFQNSNIGLIVASKWMKERAELSPIMCGKPLYHVPFGVNQQLFIPADTRRAKEALDIEPDTITLMFRADLSAYKGLDVIKEALSALKHEKRIALISVANKGLLGDFSDDYDIYEFGWITDDTELAALYQACDIFLMPSKQEAFGMMAIEAMSCGKPVLSLLGTALPDVINSPNCGLAVEQAEFTQTLQRWIDDERERLERGARSLAYAREHYSIERYTQDILNVYEDIMLKHEPCVNADAVVAQLLSLKENPYFGKNPRKDPISNTLSYSFPWRITRPIRAVKYSKNVGGGLKSFLEYMRSDSLDIYYNYEVLDSRSWRITAPLRRFVGIFSRDYE